MGYIEEIALYMLYADGVTVTEALCMGTEEKCQSLEQYPERGPELKRLGIDYFKEIHYKPYRISYQIIDKNVFVHCVLDGRSVVLQSGERTDKAFVDSIVEVVHAIK